MQKNYLIFFVGVLVFVFLSLFFVFIGKDSPPVGAAYFVGMNPGEAGIQVAVDDNIISLDEPGQIRVPVAFNLPPGARSAKGEVVLSFNPEILDCTVYDDHIFDFVQAQFSSLVHKNFVCSQEKGLAYFSFEGKCSSNSCPRAYRSGASQVLFEFVPVALATGFANLEVQSFALESREGRNVYAAGHIFSDDVQLVCGHNDFCGELRQCVEGACVEDRDGDGVVDAFDNCVAISNPTQQDADKDHLGDICDPCPFQEACDGFCGDGLQGNSPGEECDSGDANAPGSACTNTCQRATCGDGLLCSGNGCTSGYLGKPEQCDDGNRVDGDGCSAACSTETNLQSVCGDGKIEQGEVCDASALEGQTCTSLNYLGGSLACTVDCRGFDTSGCDHCSVDRDCGSTEFCAAGRCLPRGESDVRIELLHNERVVESLVPGQRYYVRAVITPNAALPENHVVVAVVEHNGIQEVAYVAEQRAIAVGDSEEIRFKYEAVSGRVTVKVFVWNSLITPGQPWQPLVDVAQIQFSEVIF